MKNENPDALLGITVPFRLGFFLVRVGVQLPSWPGTIYRGVDRLIYTPEFILGRQLTAQEHKLEAHWESYMAAMESGVLHSNLEVAMRFQQTFRNAGIGSEIIYAEIVRLPENWNDSPAAAGLKANLLEPLKFREKAHEALRGLMADIELLGYDISHPTPSFHSAIFQPGFAKRVPDLPRYLNRNGLFDTVDSSRPFLSLANEMGHGGFPFCLLSVYSPIQWPEPRDSDNMI